MPYMELVFACSSTTNDVHQLVSRRQHKHDNGRSFDSPVMTYIQVCTSFHVIVCAPQQNKICLVNHKLIFPDVQGDFIAKQRVIAGHFRWGKHFPCGLSCSPIVPCRRGDRPFPSCCPFLYSATTGDRGVRCREGQREGQQHFGGFLFSDACSCDCFRLLGSVSA